jgi:hypothetical protein
MICCMQLSVAQVAGRARVDVEFEGGSREDAELHLHLRTGKNGGLKTRQRRQSRSQEGLAIARSYCRAKLSQGRPVENRLWMVRGARRVLARLGRADAWHTSACYLDPTRQD